MGIETLAAISLGSAVLGAGVSAGGAYMSSQAAAESSRYKAAVGHINAKLAQQQGQSKALSQDIKTGAILGAQRAAYSAAGVDVESGTPMAVQVDTMKKGKLDTLTILNNAAGASTGFQQQALLDEASAVNSETAGAIGIGTSILGGVSSVSDKWLKFKSVGPYT